MLMNECVYNKIYRLDIIEEEGDGNEVQIGF